MLRPLIRKIGNLSGISECTAIIDLQRAPDLVVRVDHLAYFASGDFEYTAQVS